MTELELFAYAIVFASGLCAAVWLTLAGCIVFSVWEAGFREYLIQDSLSAELERFALLVAAEKDKELKRLNATIDELNDMQIGLRNELRSYREREKTMGWAE